MSAHDPVTAPEATIDAFHRGRFHLVQPAGRGHRAGMDAMVLAASVPSGFSGRLADLGAGAGAAGLAVVARCDAARVLLVEKSPEMADFARRSLALRENAYLADRATVLEADVTATGRARMAAGLADNSFDFVIMNPPFNASADRASPDELRREAHVMAEETVEAWLRTAAAILKPRGCFSVIARPQALGALIAAFAGRFGNAEIVPVHPYPDAPAIRILMRGRKGARGALALMPPLVLHETGEKSLSPRADAISNGTRTLFED